MRIPRISISFPGDASQGTVQPAASTLSQAGKAEVLHAQASAILENATALRATLSTSELGEENMAEAREHIRSIRATWRDFRGDYERDHLLLRLASQLEWLETLQDLERQHMDVIARLQSRVEQTNPVEAVR